MAHIQENNKGNDKKAAISKEWLPFFRKEEK